VPFEADYTCTPPPVTEPTFMAAMPHAADHEKLIWSRRLPPGADFFRSLFSQAAKHQ
jgi:hypothetical protein